MKYIVPFNKPTYLNKEIEYLKKSIENGHISGDGYFAKECERFIAKITNSTAVLLTTSCTSALEMTAILLNIKEGDEVIVPSYTFVSTANAFALRGAKPVFCDIREDTLNIDESQVEKLIKKETKAIVVVHYAGVGCEMDKIIEIANSYGIDIIEDNAHGLFGKYKGKALGSFGTFATLSFHETKNITCGEGGALLINKREYVERAEIIREKGTNRKAFFRGEVDKYTWVDIGSSYVISDLLAAFLLCQLENYLDIQFKRKCLWEKYYNSLKDWAEDNGIRLPYVPSYCEQSYHMFYLIFPDLNKRQNFINKLKEKGVYAVFHYVPLHLSKMGIKFGGYLAQCPVSEYISDRIVRLPFYTNMENLEQDLVIKCILDIKI